MKKRCHSRWDCEGSGISDVLLSLHGPNLNFVNAYRLLPWEFNSYKVKLMVAWFIDQNINSSAMHNTSTTRKYS